MYDALIEQIITKQFIASLQGDSVAHVYVKEVTDELREAIQGIPSWLEKKDRLEVCYQAACSHLGAQDPQSLDSIPDMALLQIFQNMSANIQLIVAPEGMPAPTIVTSKEIRESVVVGTVNQFLNVFAVEDYFRRNQLPPLYRVDRDKLEIAVLTALLLDAMQETKKAQTKIITAGSPFMPVGRY
jgi:hypothetical protein